MALHSYKCPKCGATNINQDKHDKFENLPNRRYTWTYSEYVLL